MVGLGDTVTWGVGEKVWYCSGMERCTGEGCKEMSLLVGKVVARQLDLLQCKIILEKLLSDPALLFISDLVLKLHGSLKKSKKRIIEDLKPQEQDTRRTSGNTTRIDPFPPSLILEAQTQVLKQSMAQSGNGLEDG
nr:hypothetical protein [Tanacetum cinerariifolium]